MARGAMSEGGVVSRTVTKNVILFVALNASTVIAVTKLRPRGKVEPEGGVQVTGRVGWQKLLAATLKFTTAPAALVASATILVGARMTGSEPASFRTQKSPLP